MEHDTVSALRESDRWLRRALVYVPILTFFVGWGTGVISTFLLFRDHEKRLSYLEGSMHEYEQRMRDMENRQGKFSTILQEKFRLNIP